MINKTLIKEARDLITLSKSLTTQWDVETVSITRKNEMEALKEQDNDPDNYRIVIYVS